MSRRNGVLRAMAGMALALTFAASAAAQSEFAADSARLVKVLKLTSGQTVADIGAGAGQLTVKLARVVGSSGRVYGTELEAGRIRAIARAADSAGLKNVTAIEGHATRTNLPERCCDALVVRFVYHHFKNPALMNASLFHSLKPGGLLAVIDFAPDGAESVDPKGRADDTHHGVTPATVLRELQQAGFVSAASDPASRSTGFLVVVRRPP